MNSPILAFISIGLWAVLAVAFAVVLLRSYVTPAPDGRTTIRLTPAERDSVPADMRAMLSTVGQITDGLASGKRDLVIQIARANGQAGMVVQPNLRLKLPEPFRQFGTQLHG